MKVVYNACFGGFSLSKKAIDWLAERGVEYVQYQTPLERHHPLLVQCVEELGAGHRTGASGNCASLRICEVPDGAPYEIDEYDGYERVVAPIQEYS